MNVSFMGDDDEVAAAGGGGPGARMGGWKAKGGVQSTPSRFFNGGKRRARAPLTAIGSNGEPGAADDADGAAARCEEEQFRPGAERETSGRDGGDAGPTCASANAAGSPPPAWAGDGAEDDEGAERDAGDGVEAVDDEDARRAARRGQSLESHQDSSAPHAGGEDEVADRPDASARRSVDAPTASSSAPPGPDGDAGATREAMCAFFRRAASRDAADLDADVRAAMARLRDDEGIDAARVLRVLGGLTASVARLSAGTVAPAAALACIEEHEDREPGAGADAIVLRPELFTEPTIAKRRSRSSFSSTSAHLPPSRRRSALHPPAAVSEEEDGREEEEDRREGKEDGWEGEDGREEEEDGREEEEERDGPEEREEESIAAAPSGAGAPRDADGSGSGAGSGAGSGDDSEHDIVVRRRGGARRGGRRNLIVDESEESSPAAPPAAAAAADALAEELRTKLAAISVPAAPSAPERACEPPPSSSAAAANFNAFGTFRSPAPYRHARCDRGRAD